MAALRWDNVDAVNYNLAVITPPPPFAAGGTQLRGNPRRAARC
jgi:hypothetical protein